MIHIQFSAIEAQYIGRLDEIKSTIANSEELSAYLDTEEHEEYEALRDSFESLLHDLYIDVAEADASQLISLEQAYLTDELEGLYLGKVLNYATLRGSYNEEFKYNIPQDHLKDIILTIANSVNFDSLIKTCKQGLQLALAISSDVWATNIFQEIKNKKVIDQIATLKPYKREFFKQRRSLLVSLKRQFKKVPFHSFGTPSDLVSLRRYVNDIIFALKSRAEEGHGNDSFSSSLTTLLSNEEFVNTNHFIKMLVTSAFTVNFSEGQAKEIMVNISKALNDTSLLNELYEEINSLSQDKRLFTPLSIQKANSVLGLLDSEYATIINLIDRIAQEGISDEDLKGVYVAKTKEFPELSSQAEVLRSAVAAIFAKEVSVLPAGNQKSFIKLFGEIESYLHGFDNEGFSKLVKESTITKIKEFIRFFTNRRSAEYQEVKGFMATTLVGHGFTTDKGIKELIKRKKEVA